MNMKDWAGFFHRKRKAEDRESDIAISHFQSQTAEISEAPDPVWARGTVLLFAGLVVSAIALSAVLRVERVVVARGLVVSETPTIVVQPLERAVVDSIEVRPGELVKQGQVLARLDPTISDADVSALERRLASFDAEIGRLEAEIANQPYVPKEPGEFSDLQVAIHRHRTAEFQASMANYDQQIAATNSELARTTLESDIYSKRYALLGEIVDMRAKLERTAAGSRLTSIQSEDNRLSIERSLAESNGLAQTARHRIEALQSERDTFREKWRADAINRLVTLRQDYSAAKEELAKATYRRSLVALRAISDAVVLDVAPVSVGSVLEAARELLRLVPLNAELELEVEISGADQGFVAVGDDVQIKFDAYAFGEHGTGRGRVRTISQDSFTRAEGPRAGEVYYRARVAILATDLRDVPKDFRLIPGMPVTADIVVGDHSILASLTGGLADSFSTGLREP